MGIHVSEDEWNRLLALYDGEPHKADGANWHHAHFGLNFRVYSDSGSIAGVRRINLKFAKEDPSYVREHFCYDMMSRFGVWTSPKSSWCRLYLKEFSSVSNPWTGQLQSASRIRTWHSLLHPFLVNDTGEDMVIRDAPSSWGNHPEYRLLEDNSDNWFKVKASSIASWTE